MRILHPSASKNSPLQKTLIGEKILSSASAKSLQGDRLLQCDLSRLGGYGFPALVAFIILLNIFVTITVLVMMVTLKRYSSAVKNCKVAGRVAAHFLNWLVQQKQVEI